MSKEGLTLGYLPALTTMMINNQGKARSLLSNYTEVQNPGINTISTEGPSRSGTTALLALLANALSRSNMDGRAIFQPAKGILRHQIPVKLPQNGVAILKETFAPEAFETYSLQQALLSLGGLVGRDHVLIQHTRLPLASFASIRTFVPDAKAMDYVEASLKTVYSGDSLPTRVRRITSAYDLMALPEVTPDLYVDHLFKSLKQRGGIDLGNPGNHLAPYKDPVYDWQEGSEPEYANEVIKPTLGRGSFGYSINQVKLNKFAQENPEDTRLIEGMLNGHYKAAMLRAAGDLLLDVTSEDIDSFIESHTFA